MNRHNMMIVGVIVLGVLLLLMITLPFWVF